jgi:hypothetical protein
MTQVRRMVIVPTSIGEPPRVLKGLIVELGAAPT